MTPPPPLSSLTGVNGTGAHGSVGTGTVATQLDSQPSQQIKKTTISNDNHSGTAKETNSFGQSLTNTTSLLDSTGAQSILVHKSDLLDNAGGEDSQDVQDKRKFNPHHFLQTVDAVALSTQPSSAAKTKISCFLVGVTDAKTLVDVDLPGFVRENPTRLSFPEKVSNGRVSIDCSNATHCCGCYCRFWLFSPIEGHRPVNRTGRWLARTNHELAPLKYTPTYIHTQREREPLCDYQPSFSPPRLPLCSLTLVLCTFTAHAAAHPCRKTTRGKGCCHSLLHLVDIQWQGPGDP